MIVCMCNAVSDREIRNVVAQGAASFAAVQSLLGVATCCGRCREHAIEVVEDALHRSAPAPATAE